MPTPQTQQRLSQNQTLIPKDASFEDEWESLTAWAQTQQLEILSSGQELSVDQIQLAKRVGVRSPEKVRVRIVTQLSTPPKLDQLSKKTAGMTIRYGIEIIENQQSCRELLAHELRHVAQYECFGSIKTFLFFYLLECDHFGYGKGPLEIDAKNAEKLALNDTAITETA